MKQTRHLGVYGLIIKNGKIALVLKSRGAYTGKLDLPGGSFEHGELPTKTLIREIKEELGCDVLDYQIFDSSPVTVQWTMNGEEVLMHHIGIFYKVNLKDYNLKSDTDNQDSLGSNWYDIDKLDESITSPLLWIELTKILNDNDKIV